MYLDDFLFLRQISHFTHFKPPVKYFKKINPYVSDLHNKNRPLNSANFSLVSEVMLTFLIHKVSIFSTFLFIEEGEITEASGWLCYYSSFGATGELSVVHSW